MRFLVPHDLFFILEKEEEWKEQSDKLKELGGSMQETNKQMKIVGNIGQMLGLIAEKDEQFDPVIIVAKGQRWFSKNRMNSDEAIVSSNGGDSDTDAEMDDGDKKLAGAMEMVLSGTDRSQSTAEMSKLTHPLEEEEDLGDEPQIR